MKTLRLLSLATLVAGSLFFASCGGSTESHEAEAATEETLSTETPEAPEAAPADSVVATPAH